jgi:hypothetical protein
MQGRFYRLTEPESQQWITRYPQLAQYYQHSEYDWEDDEEGDEIYVIPESEQLILHIALSEYHVLYTYPQDPRDPSHRVIRCANCRVAARTLTCDQCVSCDSPADTWHCVTCKQYAVPQSHRNGDQCVDCVIKTFKGV